MSTGLPDSPAAHLLGSNGSIHAVAYSASPGTYILAGSSDRQIRLYNPAPAASAPAPRPSGGSAAPQGRLIQTYAAHGYEVLSLDVAGDNERFASCGGDRAVFLWDVASATTLRRFGGLQGHTSRVNVVKFAGEGDSVVVSGGFDTSVKLWDCRSNSGKPIQSLDEAGDSVTSVVVRGPEVLVGSVDGRVRGYDVRMGRMVVDVLGGSVTSLDVTKDGKGLLVGTLDSKIRLMDRDTGSCLRSYAAPTRQNTELRIQSILGGREKYILAGDEGPDDSGDGNGRLWVWDLLGGRVAKKLAVPWGPEGYEGKRRAIGRDGKEKERKNVVTCVAWREDGWGDQFCVGGTSGVVTVYGNLRQ